MVPLGDQAVVAPAVVAVRPDGSIVTGDAAERRAVSQPAQVARGLKRRLGDPEPVGLGDVSYPVATLLGAQLRDVVTRVSDREGGPPERVVLTHPTTWTPTRRGRFEEVARAAGLEAPLLVTDAEAAVQHAAPSRLRDGGIVAVYDLGGGGFEATVVRTVPAGRRSSARRRAPTCSAARTSTRRSCPTSTTPWAARSPASTWTTHARPWHWPGCARTACWPRRPCPWTPRPSSPSSSPAGTSRSG